MKSYHEEHHFDEAAVSLWRAACRLVEALPDPEPGEEPWRCHEIVRVVGKLLERETGEALIVVDGKYGHVSHSWLLYKKAGYCPVILDVYACGRLPQVQLVALDLTLPHGLSVYSPTTMRADIREDLCARLLANCRLRPAPQIL